MTDVRIRKVDPWVVESLWLRAREPGNSLEAELRELLHREAMRPKLELADELRRMRGELEVEEARVRCEHWLGRLQKGLFTLTPDSDLLSDAVTPATELKHAVQDCLYLAAARRFDVPLITADRTFRDRAFAFDARVALLLGCEGN